MTVTFHVAPNDNPIQSNKHTYISSLRMHKQFSLAQCRCTVTISEQGKQIYKQQLVEKKESKPNIWGTSMSYIFPQQDVYHVVITGTPKIAKAFQPFTISWYFRVDTNSPGIVPEPPSDIPVLVATLFGGIVFLTLLVGLLKRIYRCRKVANNKSVASA